MPKTNQKPGHGGGEEDGHNHPMEREQQGGHSEQRDATLAHPHDPIENQGGSQRRFLLSAMERIVVARILVIFQIDLGGLRMQQIMYVVNDCLGLGFSDKRRQRLA
jgi:hypothetical protein